MARSNKQSRVGNRSSEGAGVAKRPSENNIGGPI